MCCCVDCLNRIRRLTRMIAWIINSLDYGTPSIVDFNIIKFFVWPSYEIQTRRWSLQWWAVIQTFLIRSSGRYSRLGVSSLCTRLSLNERMSSQRPAVCTQPVIKSRNLFEYSNLVVKVLLKLLSQRNLWITFWGLQFCTR